MRRVATPDSRHAIATRRAPPGENGGIAVTCRFELTGIGLYCKSFPMRKECQTRFWGNCPFLAMVACFCAFWGAGGAQVDAPPETCFDLSFPAPSLHVGADGFTCLSLAGASLDSEPGRPSLPHLSRSFELPPGMAVAEVVCERVSADSLVLPAPLPWGQPSVLPGETVFCERDETVYTADAFYPVSSLRNWRTDFAGERGTLSVEILPVRVHTLRNAWRRRVASVCVSRSCRVVPADGFSPNRRRVCRRVSPTSTWLSRRRRSQALPPLGTLTHFSPVAKPTGSVRTS